MSPQLLKPFDGSTSFKFKGHNFKSRCGENILKNANISELICSDQNDYIKKAIQLSKDINVLKDLRKRYLIIF